MEFVVANIEDGIKLGDMQHVMHLLRKVQQLKFSAGVSDGGEAAHQRAHSGAIDVINFGKVQDDLFLPLVNQAADGGAQFVDLVPEHDPAAQIQNRDVGHLARADR